MSRLFYIKLAATNIKKNSKTYIPYILSCIGMVIMFYNLNFVAFAEDIGGDSESLRMVLKLGMVVVGFYSVIFMLYTNSFLIKRRKKEFGLFNILGMEKKHIARIMFFENLIICLLCLSVGIIAGISLSKLMILLLLKIIGYNVSFGFEIPMVAVVATIVLFGAIFFINLIYNILQVHLSKPIELLKSGNVGEKEPKTKWVSAISGVICLGIAYYIALATESPLAALKWFFIAVMLVIIGTNFLFTAGSIAILKLLRKNKKYYYRTKHFISVSGMIYRMKRNAAGLANICILSTMVIVMLSTTVSLYIGFEDVIRTRFPRNIIINASSASDSQVEVIDKIVEEQIALYNTERQNTLSYRYMDYIAFQDGDAFTVYSNEKSSSNIALLTFMELSEFNKLMNKSESLSQDEALVYTFRGKISGNTLDLNGYKLKIKDQLESFYIDGEMTAMVSRSYIIVVNDIETIKEINKAFNKNHDGDFVLAYYYGFDLDADRDTQINLTRTIDERIKELIPDNFNVAGAESSREGIYTLYGGLLYLGIFLGSLFIMETVLIIYYKQITEGYDDKERFEIMQKVGMSRLEVKKAVKSQVIKVFFIPLITAIIHLAFAFKVITKLLETLNLTNVPLFAICTVVTIVVFAIFYTLVYAMTAKTYYKIVS